MSGKLGEDCLTKMPLQTVTAVPSLVHLLLLFIWFVVFLGGISRQKARTGTSDYAMWATVASLSTFMVTLILTLIEGLLRLDWLVIVLVITLFSGVWLFLDKRKSEI
jgi:L-asparagine transporter-like permease